MVAFFVFSLLLALRIWDPVQLEILRLRTFDLYQKLNPRPIIPERPVVIVDIDDDSLGALGQWPWPRTRIAEMVERLDALGAQVIGFDVVFPEPDRMSPGRLAENLPSLDAETVARLKSLPSNDQHLADVMRGKKVVLGMAGSRGPGNNVGRPDIRRKIVSLQQPPAPHLVQVPDLVRNIPPLEAAAEGIGLFTLGDEPDQVVRRVPALQAVGDRTYPSLFLEVLRVAKGRGTIPVEATAKGVTSIGVSGQSLVPTDSNGRVWPWFARHDPEKFVSAREVLNGTVDAARIEGKIVVVGTSAAGLLELVAVPTEGVMTGIEAHAQLVESALVGAYLKRPEKFDWAEVAMFAGGSLMIIGMVPVLGAWWTLVTVIVGAAAAIPLSWTMFQTAGLLFDVSYPLAGVTIVYTVLSYVGFAAEEAERRRVRAAFSHYLSPTMVERLASDTADLRLGGEARDMSILFCDIRGFTGISEGYDAGGLTALLNQVLTPLTDTILEHGGTVDKYMGDSIMAFWNAPLDDPDHARNACLAALEMNERLSPLNERLMRDAKAARRLFSPIRVGIGINSGKAVVGNLGSDQRFDYSVIGDNVNLASRLEGQCKAYGVDIVMGERTHAQVEKLGWLEVDLVRVVGRVRPVRLYALLGDESLADDEAFKAFKKAHDSMLKTYRNAEWETALGLLHDGREYMTQLGLGSLYQVYTRRIEDYMQTPPKAGWNGVHVASLK